MKVEDPEVRQFLDRSMILRLAALSLKGRPNIRCLWFVRRQGSIYMPTHEITAIGRGIVVHPDVSLLFDGERGARSGRVLRVRGRAVFRQESDVVRRVMLGIARKYYLTPPGLRNLLAHAGTVPVTVRFYTQGWRQVRGEGLGAEVLEVRPESFEFLPRSPAQAAS